MHQTCIFLKQYGGYLHKNIFYINSAARMTQTKPTVLPGHGMLQNDRNLQYLIKWIGIKYLPKLSPASWNANIEKILCHQQNASVACRCGSWMMQVNT